MLQVCPVQLPSLTGDSVGKEIHLAKVGKPVYFAPARVWHNYLMLNQGIAPSFTGEVSCYG